MAQFSSETPRNTRPNETPFSIPLSEGFVVIDPNGDIFFIHDPQLAASMNKQ
jgi:hypothetical protein